MVCQEHEYLREGEFMKNKYWEECLASSFDEHGIIVTTEQLKAVASDIQIGHENIGLAFYVPENPMISEVARLNTELKDEREKVICRECSGYGRIITYWGTRQSNSECRKCAGEGRHK